MWHSFKRKKTKESTSCAVSATLVIWFPRTAKFLSAKSVIAKPAHTCDSTKWVPSHEQALWRLELLRCTVNRKPTCGKTLWWKITACCFCSTNSKSTAAALFPSYLLRDKTCIVLHFQQMRHKDHRFRLHKNSSSCALRSLRQQPVCSHCVLIFLITWAAD